MTAQYSYSIWVALCPCLFPHYRCKRANMLRHPPNTSTLTPVPASSHSDDQPHSVSTLPLLINKFITRWTEHKTTLRLGRANRKQTAVSATVVLLATLGPTASKNYVHISKEQVYNKKALCLYSYHPLFYWLVMSMCIPACWCLSLYTCTYWALQKEILWAEFNTAETIPTSLSVKTTIYSWMPTSFSKLLNAELCWPICFCCTPRPFGCEPFLASRVYCWIQSNGGSWRRFSHTVMQPFVSQSSGRGPLWCRCSTVRGAAAASSGIDSPCSLEPAVTDSIYHFI